MAAQPLYQGSQNANASPDDRVDMQVEKSSDFVNIIPTLEWPFLIRLQLGETFALLPCKLVVILPHFGIWVARSR